MCSSKQSSKKSPATTAMRSPEPPDSREDNSRLIKWVKIGPRGQVNLPAAMREALDLAEGSDVLLELDQEEVRIVPRNEALARVQARIRKHIPRGVSLVDELIAERRREAKRECEE